MVFPEVTRGRADASAMRGFCVPRTYPTERPAEADNLHRLKNLAVAQHGADRIENFVGDGGVAHDRGGDVHHRLVSSRQPRRVELEPVDHLADLRRDSGRLGDRNVLDELVFGPGHRRSRRDDQLTGPRRKLKPGVLSHALADVRLDRRDRIRHHGEVLVLRDRREQVLEVLGEGRAVGFGQTGHDLPCGRVRRRGRRRPADVTDRRASKRIAFLRRTPVRSVSHCTRVRNDCAPRGVRGTAGQPTGPR